MVKLWFVQFRMAHENLLGQILLPEAENKGWQGSEHEIEAAHEKVVVVGCWRPHGTENEPELCNDEDKVLEDPTPSISEIMERIQKLEETVNKIIDVLNGETKA